ncbi:PRC-barrel domain-containing protein [Streptomyces sp. S.PNR 29]|uniref:PRC-barrel domain-containing protein n=1 Tax=Streptomyces sp. S.PNR 29 TaxID=2973805 RepID=UPI0025B0B6DE|nr:PRC-barrel domain-containing protein [Streptomyces sp. S.PNR 29]MDN0199049.1 PRC-barrel domain-containing protein [Streptomyces sp. S.PNR 29]
MMLFSQVKGLPVVTLTEAAELGVVTSLAVDAASGTVTHVRVHGKRPRRDTVLAWDALHAVGADAVLVRSTADAVEPPPGHEVLGRRVLAETGDERGTVQDVAFDPATGRVLTVLTALDELPADRLLGLGDHALVVRAD